MQEEVLEFINRRWKNSSAHWLDGNCYWFAHILCTRFPYLDIIYLPVQGHFVAGLYEDKIYFDWAGLAKPIEGEVPVRLEWILINDINWYKRLIRDCIE